MTPITAAIQAYNEENGTRLIDRNFYDIKEYQTNLTSEGIKCHQNHRDARYWAVEVKLYLTKESYPVISYHNKSLMNSWL